MKLVTCVRDRYEKSNREAPEMNEASATTPPHTPFILLVPADKLQTSLIFPTSPTCTAPIPANSGGCRYFSSINPYRRNLQSNQPGARAGAEGVSSPDLLSLPSL